MSNDLLSPSLAGDDGVSIFSTGALMAAAFFGGTIAVLIIAALNSHYLGRLGKDLPMLLLLVLVGAAVTFVGLEFLFGDGGRALRLAVRTGGFAAFGIAWLMHKPQLRALSTMGVKPRSPWVPVALACVVAIGAHAVLASMIVEGGDDGV